VVQARAHASPSAKCRGFSKRNHNERASRRAKHFACNPFGNGHVGAIDRAAVEVINTGGISVEAIGLLVTLEARSGKEAEAEAFLKSAHPLALDEKTTLKWYALKLGPGKFGIFDTFATEAGRNAHLTGEIARH
jgi:hypothetical protein